MIKNKKHFIFTIVVVTLAVAINVFIIVHSCLNGKLSTNESGKIVALLKTIINAFGKDAINEGNIDTFTHVVRKLVGHFGLFVFSGAFSTWAFHLSSYYLNKYKWWYGLIFTLFFGLFLASLTELIQTFVPGRSGQITDVLIDYSGYILGTGIVVLISFILYKKGKITLQNDAK